MEKTYKQKRDTCFTHTHTHTHEHIHTTHARTQDEVYVSRCTSIYIPHTHTQRKNVGFTQRDSKSAPENYDKTIHPGKSYRRSRKSVHVASQTADQQKIWRAINSLETRQGRQPRRGTKGPDFTGYCANYRTHVTYHPLRCAKCGGKS